jgi:hypothetical protein
MKLKLLLITLFTFSIGVFSSGQSTINITTTGGSFTSEKWVNITDMADGAGTQIWGQGDGTYGNAQGLINQDIMLAPGTYWVNCYDRFADGWDGTTIDVTAYGASIGNNGGVSPDDGTDNDAGSGWETPADELEASFMIVVPSPPACQVATGITSSNILDTSADFSWTASASETGGYNWEVVPQGDAQGVNVVTSGTTISGASTVSITGLSSGTSYDFYIQTDCGTSGMSTWAGPIVFNTAVVACGSTVYDTGGAAGDYSNNESYTITYLPDTAANVVTLDFTLVDLENCCDTLTIYDGLDNTAPILEADLESIGSFTAINTDGAITIEFTSDGSVVGAGWEANYTCIPRPSCVNVSGITMDSTTADSVTVSWTENNIPAGTDWEVVAVAAGDPVPAVGTSNATASPFTIPSLMANTSYDVYVRADCSTAFVGLMSVTTDCAVVTTYPYTTDFTTNVPNACWEEAGSGEIVDGPMTVGSSNWRAGTSYENLAGTVIPSNAVNLYTNSFREWLISDEYDMTGTANDVLSIEVAVTNWNSATVPDVMGSDDQVDLLITTDSGTTWTSLMTWTAANQPVVTGTRELIDLSSYTGTVQFAFFASDGTVDDGEDYDFHVGMFTIDGTAGNEDNFVSSLSLYPNPVSGDQVTISTDGSSASSIEVAVFNTLGQQVMTRSYDQVNRTININNISSLSNGMYFVKISSGTQQATLKFIKE